MAGAIKNHELRNYYRGAYDWDAENKYPEVEKVSPGDTIKAYLRFLSPQEHYGNVSVGMPFLIGEGSRTVTYGIATGGFDQLEVDASDFE